MNLCAMIAKYMPIAKLIIPSLKNHFMCDSKSGGTIFDINVVTPTGEIISPSECANEPKAYLMLDPYSTNPQIRYMIMSFVGDLQKYFIDKGMAEGVSTYRSRRHWGLEVTFNAYREIYNAFYNADYCMGSERDQSSPNVDVPPAIETNAGVTIVDLTLPPEDIALKVPCNGIRYNPYFCASGDVFEYIYDLEKQKMVMTGWLHNPFSGAVLRRSSILLLVGPPATGKTMFLESVVSRLRVMNHSKVFKPPVRISGNTTTWRGLIDTILDNDANMYVIDELDKAKSDFYTKVIEMYNGAITNTIHRSSTPTLTIKGEFFIIGLANTTNRMPNSLLDRSVIVPVDLSQEEVVKVAKSILQQQYHHINEERVDAIVYMMTSARIPITVRSIMNIYSVCSYFKEEKAFNECIKTAIRGMLY